MSEPLTLVRPDENGDPDQIMVDCDRIHLERMDEHTWWLGISRGQKGICFVLSAAGARLRVAVVKDELGAVDDTRRTEGA
jgi:hypothetical protein